MATLDETKRRTELAETVANDPSDIDKILILSHQMPPLQTRIISGFQ